MSLPNFTQPVARPPQPDRRQTPPPRRGNHARRQLIIAAAAAVIVGVGAAVAWQMTRPTPSSLTPPELTPAVRDRMLAALGWPATRPILETLDGPKPAEQARIDQIAAADVDGDGTPEWGVSYTWLGPAVTGGARAMQPGFAIVSAGASDEVIFRASSFGGWSGPKDKAFNDVTAAQSHVDTVDLGPDGFGFLQHVSLESSRGGRLAFGSTRLYVPAAGGWTQAWAGETESRQQQGPTEETARSGTVVLQDIDQDGRPEILVSENWYERHLDAAGSGPHFAVAGPGQLVYRRGGVRYALAGMLPQGETAMTRLRAARPLYAIRTARPVKIDGKNDEWRAQTLVGLTGMKLEDPALLKYKLRDRAGIEDASGEVRFMWDSDRLYVWASVVDNTVVPGVAGRDLYKGDHLALWIDRDLAGDFDQVARSDDDFQIGFSPGSPAEAHCWVPTPGRRNLQVASRPLVDPYSGGVYGYELEGAIPWADLGGPPGSLPVGLARAVAAAGAAAEPIEWRLAAALGLGIVLTDADKRPQELAYVSSPEFGWAAPATFNSLLLVDVR